MSGVPGWRTLHGTESRTNDGYISNSRHVEKQLTTARKKQKCAVEIASAHGEEQQAVVLMCTASAT